MYLAAYKHSQAVASVIAYSMYCIIHNWITVPEQFISFGPYIASTIVQLYEKYIFSALNLLNLGVFAFLFEK